ncbi:GNAT family N-acetyltransferase [Streptomyces sp. YU58]|uniref:GNAT family N-acetyltransferase n=1 Tax=Streptomyces sp. SX92 TaxID=3158972 RepID=UPI0027B92EB9|nr:GNAT family N-acetyltransferase [Streptomyces coralus]WLW52453.1 GNAT family N-acetyltransferase [Streptomyces coralus]
MSPPVTAGWQRFRYAWENGPGLPAQLHAAADRLAVRCDVTLSRAAEGPSFAYVGLPRSEHHVLPFLEQQRSREFGGPDPVREVLGRRPWTAALREAAHSADMVFAGCGEGRLRALRATPRLLPDTHSATGPVLPFRLHLILPVEGGSAAMLRRVSGNERRQFTKQLAEHGWQWEPATGRDDFDYFYQRMHLPTMHGRHGEDTRSLSERMAREVLLRDGRLFFVTRQGERVAGLLCHGGQPGRPLTMRLLGVLDGAPEHYRTGVVKAVYYLCVDWACANSVPVIDMSGTEPFLSKGIVQFKRRFHPRVALPPGHHARRRLWPAALRDTAEVRAFLVANPFLALGEDGAPSAVYPYDRDRPARKDLRAGFSGLPEDRLLDLDELFARTAPAAVTAGAAGD